MPSKWQRLHVSFSGSVPTLLCQFTFTGDGYGLYITDLTYIWSEHLDRKSILRRADEDGTTIDPSEDDDQFTVLLQKIEEALHHDSSGHSAALSRGSEGANLHLLTTTKLPAPLQPLRWRFCLSQDPHSAATDQLLLPLVKAEAVWQSREKVLIDQLMKKDWVLGKLFDKLEALGIDIGTIFPGVSVHRPGQKDTMLSHTAKYIKGVEPFDKDSWIRETNISFPELSSAANFATEATGSRVSDADRLRILTAPADGWWKQLSTAVVDSCSDNEPRKPAVDKRPFDGSLETDTDSGNEDDDDDDEFERQETPPHLRRTTAKALSPSPGAEPSSKRHEMRSPSRSEHPAVQRPFKGGGLGVIGGRKRPQSNEKTPPSSTSEVDIPERRAKPPVPPPRVTDSDATASETDGDDDLAPPPPSKLKAPAPAPVKRGLGVIGGKKKEHQPSLPSSSNRQPFQPTSDQPSKSGTQAPPKQTGRLGVIGGVARSTKRTAESQPPTDAASSAKSENSDDASEGATTELAPPRAARSVAQEQKPKLTPPAEQKKESEQQRADRKRDELKRQLEAKAKAPAKKKRRF
ncbi:XLF-domain-containing protein [Aspergillus uvarum CBS 121591]|uniref:Non-homologous end-joining factor 1 n=1 Tax=Aspergillus uvarum CBS 121591 TaxID=1448315 RepID=A0A319CZ06_9EURO|nr:XLF-domain-containing protein [Aspergillus uvarum CBS 121591]PYH84053.1 XLF-domain-containing protein [Aspergillus uvarum CBS 121591]